MPNGRLGGGQNRWGKTSLGTVGRRISPQFTAIRILRMLRILCILRMQRIQRFQRVLRAVHSALGGLRPRGGRPCFDLGAWLAFLESTGLLISELSREDARRCFLEARVRAVDEAEDDRRASEALDFPGFLEAICGRRRPSRASARAEAPSQAARWTRRRSRRPRR